MNLLNMGKPSKKTAPKAEVVAHEVPAKPLKKRKREASEVIEKEASKKKQKNDVEQVIEKEITKKKQKKDVAAKEGTVKKVKVKTEKKKIVKKQESSDDSSSSESEEEQKVVNRKVAGPAKNGSVSAPKKKEDSSEESSSEEDSYSSDEDVSAAKRAPAAGVAAAVKNVTAKNKSRHGWSLVAMDTGVDVKANARKSVLSSEKKEANTPSTQPQTLGSKTLFIQNLSCNTEKADVENFFKECVDVHFATYPDGALKGFGLVEFATVEAAQKARDEKNGQILGSRRVYLDIASVRGAYTPQSRDASSKRRSIGSQAGRMIS